MTDDGNHEHLHAASPERVALVTGGTAGLGRELVQALTDRGWIVVTDGRRNERFAGLAGPGIVAIHGDITDPDHRTALRAEIEHRGRLDLLVHNASTLGPTPLRSLAEVTIDDLQRVWRSNVGAPLVLTGDLLPWLVASEGVLLSISSDVAVEHYQGWGLYGASKAALDHVTLTFAAEQPALTAYAVDPGDMRTELHQAAFPGEDISDRPLPVSVVPHLLALLDQRPPSGRYRAADVEVAALTGAFDPPRPVGAAR